MVVHLLLAELLLVVQLLRTPQLRRRKRVRRTADLHCKFMLITCAEKEESDEDMGFGLFD